MVKQFIDNIAENRQVRSGHILLTYVATVIGLPLLVWSLLQVYGLQTEKLKVLEAGQKTIVSLMVDNRTIMLSNRLKNEEQDRFIAQNDNRLARVEERIIGHN